MNRGSITIKTIALCLVLALLAVGVIVALVKVTGIDKTKTITSSQLDWQLGYLDDDGEYVESDSVMMTKKHLGIDGLKIEVVKKPGVHVVIALFDKKGNLLGEPDEIETSESTATTWLCADYLDANSEIAEGKPAYAIVFLQPVKDVELTTSNMRTYAKQVTISYNR